MSLPSSFQFSSSLFSLLPASSLQRFQLLKAWEALEQLQSTSASYLHTGMPVGHTCHEIRLHGGAMLLGLLPACLSLPVAATTAATTATMP